jgi:UDP-glucose 4-epimerase
VSSLLSARGEPATVLITGGAGFVGGFLGRELARQGCTVHLVDNLARGRKDRFLDDLLRTGNVELLECDLAAPGGLADLGDRYTHVFHLAAILGVQNVLDRPYATLMANVRLLETAIDFCRRQRDLSRLVFASTSEVYGGSLLHMDLPVPTPEGVPLALPDLSLPRTSYMLSKLYGEAMVRHAGVPFTIVRPHNVYGPRMGMAHVIPQLMEKAQRLGPREALEVFSVDHRRSFCFIDDAVEMMVRAAGNPNCAGEVLNLGSEGPEVSIGELAELILRTVGRDAAIDARPATPGSPTRRCPDMSRMAERTGYRSRISLEEGCRRTWDWYRETVFSTNPSETAR